MRVDILIFLLEKYSDIQGFTTFVGMFTMEHYKWPSW